MRPLSLAVRLPGFVHLQRGRLGLGHADEPGDQGQQCQQAGETGEIVILVLTHLSLLAAD